MAAQLAAVPGSVPGAGSGLDPGPADSSADKNPIQLDDLDLRIPSFDKLIRQKRPCPRCGKSRSFYCEDCLVHLPGVDGWTVPAPTLPISIDVVHHPQEKRKKSSALPSIPICPDQLRCIEFPDEIPDYDPETTILLFPSKNAVSVKELPRGKFTKAIVVDSTWQQARQVLRHPKLQNLPTARIDSYKTRFWRFQSGLDEGCLATVEAMYYFCREMFAGHHPDLEYDGRYDNLLFYFKLQYDIVQQSYRNNPQRQFNKRHYANYIRYDDAIQANLHLFKPKPRPSQPDAEPDQEAAKAEDREPLGDSQAPPDELLDSPEASGKA